MSFSFWIPGFTARLLAGLATTLSLLFSAGYSYAENAADFVAVPPLINVSASGDKPNVLVILDNSNSMDEAPTGRAVGSANSGSKSEIARTAVKSIVNNFGDKTRLGLMAYKQENIVKRNLHDSQYDASFDPANYDPTFTGDRASTTKRNRVSNPTDGVPYVYYNVALPFYSGSNQGTRFCYSSAADFDNGSETTSGPWDSYDCYQRRTDTSDSSTTGFSNSAFSRTFSATDSDFAQNILDFGTYLSWQYVSPSWFSNSSPGQGMLHVAIDDVNASHKTQLLSKLDTSQFSSSSDTPLRNAGLTPIAGTLESAGNYFGGTLSDGEVVSGVSKVAPTPNFCGTQDYVVLVTDGLPSVDKSGSKVADVTAAIDAAAAEAAALLSQGVRTYVVGFGLPTGVDASLLNKIAVAGGTDATLFANDSDTLNAALGSIFLNIFNRSSSSSAAAVLANNARGEGAIFQALYSPSIQDAAGTEVTWTGSLFGLFIDRFGLLREDTNQNAKLDGYDVDRVANYSYNVVEDKTEVELFVSGDSLTPPDTATDTPVATVGLEDLKALWRAQDQLSEISDPVTQRLYSASASTGRYILSSIDGENTLGFRALPSSDLTDLVAAEQDAKSDLDTAQNEYDVAQAQAEAASDTVVLKQAELDNANANVVTQTNNVATKTEELDTAAADTSAAQAAYDEALSDYYDDNLGFYNASLAATEDYGYLIDDYDAEQSQTEAGFDDYVAALIAEGGIATDPDVQAAKADYDASVAELDSRVSAVSGALSDYNDEENQFFDEADSAIPDCVDVDLFAGTACESFYNSVRSDTLNTRFDVRLATQQVKSQRVLVGIERDAYVAALDASGANTNKPAVEAAETVYSDQLSQEDGASQDAFNLATGSGSGIDSFWETSLQFLDTAQSVVNAHLAHLSKQSDEADAVIALDNAISAKAAAVASVPVAEDQLGLAQEDRDTTEDALDVRLAALTAAESAYRMAFDDTFLNYLDTGSGELANKVVRFIRGEEGIDGFRNRTIDLDGDGSSEVMRLGDIVNSTPALVARPSSNYDVLHSDSTYAEFRAKYKDRRNVVYVGANDGMLHAFNAGFWNDSASSFETTNSFADAATTAVAHPLGSELWSYIPKAALPHLQWLTNPSYAHTYYVDGQPLTFDANVFPDDATHPNGWGTVLVVGMRLGGGTTEVDSDADGTDDQTLRSTYIVMDVTDPEQPPELMAEISHTDLGFTTSVPALFKQRVKGTSYESPTVNNWYLVFGSGPTDIEKVVSNQQAKIFAYDLEARSFLGGFPKAPGGGYSDSFVGDVGVVDWEDNYVDNTAYFGIISGDPAATSDGSVERLRLDLSGFTTTSTLIDTNRPVVARPHLTKDGQGRRWVYFGTGRLFAAEDNITTQQNRYFGIYEPVASGTETDATVTTGELRDVTGIEVEDTGAVSESGSAVSMPDGTDVDNFNQLKYELPRQKQGWYRDLENNGSDPTGRNLSSSDSVRSVLFFTEYTPSALSCKPEGTSRLFGIDFQAGVAPPFEVFSPEDSSDSADDEVAPPYIDLGQGLASGPTAVSNDSSTKLGNSSDSVVTIVTQSSTGQLQLNDATVGSTSNSRQSWREVKLQ
jgi:hypothetical protein